jgi:cardiolipin synthase
MVAPTRARTGSLPLARALVRQAERAMVRASDAPLVRGNSARLLVDGPVAFKAWLDAIAGAREWIHLENYIVRNDRTGRIFIEALAERARQGVRVRVLYDWLGAGPPRSGSGARSGTRAPRCAPSRPPACATR